MARRPDGTFEKGTTGNAGGRPRTSGKVRQYREDGTADDLLDIAIKIARDVSEDSRVRLAAIAFVWDRIWGKPATVDAEGQTVSDTVINIVRPSAKDIAYDPEPVE